MVQMLFFILEGVAQTSSQTVALVQGVKELMQVYKHRMRDELPKIYSHTARKYLDEVVSLGLLEKHKNGKDNFYLNTALYELLLNVNEHA